MKTRRELDEAFEQLSLITSIRNSKVACVLVMILMPIGYVMDIFVHGEWAEYLFILRLMTSACAALVLIGLRQPNLSDRQYRLACMGWYLVPAFFISCMIAQTGGANSSYYAGLNLVILAVSSVLQASLLETLIAITLIGLMYLTAVAVNIPQQRWSGETLGMFVNNFTFICYTCGIVLTGNFFYNRLRFREFTLRYELDENRQKLEESNRKLKQLDEVKGRFFANISHELRTPLTLMIAPLETLLNKSRFPMEPKARELLATMQVNGMRLLKLINDLLDLVRLDSGVMKLKREPIHIERFLQGLVSSASQMADDKHIQLRADVAPDVETVCVDRDKLEKVLLNLQFNALKFTPSGGRITLRGRREGEALILQVEDTGMGISKEGCDRVFDRFWQQDDSSKRKYQGVGIGLSLVRELTEVQGGKVSVASEPGVGTTFTVRLPYLTPGSHIQEGAPKEETEPVATPTLSPSPASPAEEACEPPAESSSDHGTPEVASEEWLANLYRRAELFPSITPVQETVRVANTTPRSHQPRLLIADDEPDMLRFIKSQLEEDYQIVEAVDGQQAIDLSGQFLPDVILLDMMMPEKDGMQACREIRERSITRHIPIVMLTARADEETKLKALEAGVSDFLAKPFSSTELQVRLNNLVHLYQFQRRLSQQNQTLESTIDQLKETESKLVQTEKLASLGRMSAGIIHEINNPLNFASTGLFALRKMSLDFSNENIEQYNEVLHDIEEGLNRVKTIVSDLRSFSHHDDQALDTVDLAGIVQSSLRFLSHEIREDVRVEQVVPEHLTIQANKNKMIQVLVNLLQNSLDAMQEKEYPPGDLPCIQIIGREEKGQVVLIVRDNGTGIDDEATDKIFDPFFTTKDVGQGMGLGLSICYRIIQDFNGVVNVQSEPGQYCEFKIQFPQTLSLAS